MFMKECKICKIEKNFDNLVKDKRKEDGCRNVCLECNYLINERRVESKINLLEKNCKICDEIKSVDNFSKDKFSKDGFAISCKKCRKLYYESNKHKMNREIYLKNYRNNNKQKRNEELKIRRKLDPIFSLSQSIRCAISTSLKKNKFDKKLKTQEILGCSFEEFKIHLEYKFEPWMTWKNRGLYNGEFDYGWDIDHIIPISIANTREEILKLNHFTNLQPLCSYENRHIKRDLIVITPESFY